MESEVVARVSSFNCRESVGREGLRTMKRVAQAFSHDGAWRPLCCPAAPKYPRQSPSGFPKLPSCVE